MRFQFTLLFSNRLFKRDVNFGGITDPGDGQVRLSGEEIPPVEKAGLFFVPIFLSEGNLLLLPNCCAGSMAVHADRKKLPASIKRPLRFME
ncbi:MAG: hypothetical protein ACPGVN_08505 [Alphaproteobacteria bacterium]